MPNRNKYTLLIVHNTATPGTSDKSQKDRVQDLVRWLKPHFARVVEASDQEAYGLLPEIQPDLIIADYSVLNMGSILFCKKINENTAYSLIPFIFIADSRSYDHRLNAFEMGAADFLSRPFAKDDLLRKVRTHIKNRRRILEDGTAQIGNLKLHGGSETVYIDNDPISLTQIEYKILYHLLMIPRQVVTRTELYENVWGKGYTTTGRLDTQLYNLKKKLAGFNGRIKSVNKVGMRILCEESTFSQEPKKVELQLLPPEPHP